MSESVARYRVGVKRVCITPDLPCEMAGYFHSRVAQTVARGLFATAMAIESDGQVVVIVGSDLIAMTDPLCMPAFERANREHGVPVQNCMACATHTHTGPEVRPGGYVPICEDYVQKAAGLITEAVMGALESMTEAALCVGQMRAPGLAHNRLSRCADGSEIFGRQDRGSKVIGAAGPEDDSVQTLSVYGPNKTLRGVAVNFACHPDLSGGYEATAIDSDWPGEMVAHLMQIHGEDVACMVLQGTAGDINHTDHRATTPRWLPGGRSAVARGVAGAVLYAMETASPISDTTVSARKRELEIPYYSRDETLYAMIDELRAKGDDATYFEQNLIKKVDAWPNDGQSDRLSVSVTRVGELAIVGLPGEIFTGWGLEIKRYSPAEYTFVVELASSHDGLTGYKATTDQALRGARAKGAYGALPTLSQRHCPESGQIMVDSAIEMLHELW